MDWLAEGELRIGLGCMRLTGEAPILAALDAGVTVFDSARAYLGNEELLGRLLPPSARVVTKGGMARPDGGWRPDGRARAILEDCEASLRALGRPIDLYLLHAPDPRTPFATSLRALGSLVDRGYVPRIGVCNLNRQQLKEALEAVPLTAIQVSPQAFEGGVVSLALERGLWVLIHSPFGGPKKRIRDPQKVLAGIIALHPRMVALPGATRVETARDSAAAGRLVLDDPRFVPRITAPTAATGDGEVVLIAGLSGAGKSTWVERFPGYTRLNRDSLGGSLAKIAAELERRLAAGERRLVLDNTYLTRKNRHAVLKVAARHGVPVRCLYLELPLAEAQRNVIGRILNAHGRLLRPEELEGTDPTRLGPRVLYQQARQLEPPEEDEGFSALERIPFVRRAEEGGSGRAIALEALHPEILGEGPRLVFAWLPEGTDSLQAPGLEVELAACTHPAGPPICWCRPPLPGLLLAFMHRHRLSRLTVVGRTPTHRRMAEAIGADYEAG